jgi:hypothetical protein
MTIPQKNIILMNILSSKALINLSMERSITISWILYNSGTIEKIICEEEVI